MKNSGVNAADGAGLLFQYYLDEHDFAAGSIRGFRYDIQRFANWFSTANGERFDVTRVTTRDVADFKKHLREERLLAVATVNRNLVTIRRYFEWLEKSEVVERNPAKPVKELRRQQLAPRGLDPQTVRKLLREVDLRTDLRSKAVFTTFLFTGCRVSDLVRLKLADIQIQDESGYATFRNGKGGKERTVPLPVDARSAIREYLRHLRPFGEGSLFYGERGPLTDKGVRAVCSKYGKIIGTKIRPHDFRHTFARRFLATSNNDLVSLAQLLGHESLDTTARYTKRTCQQLAELASNLSY